MKIVSAARRLALIFLSLFVGAVQAQPTVPFFTGNADTGVPVALARGGDRHLWAATSKAVLQMNADGTYRMIESLPAPPREFVNDGGLFYITTVDDSTPVPTGTVYRLWPDGPPPRLTTIANVALTHLLVGKDGNLYGTGVGTQRGVYRLTAPFGTQGVLTKISDLDLDTLVEGYDGNLWGIESVYQNTSPPSYVYNVYEITHAGVATRTDSFGCADGVAPMLTSRAPSSGLYGVSRGLYSPWIDCQGNGVIFSIDESGKYARLATFSQFDDGGPSAPLLEAGIGEWGISESQRLFQYTVGNGVQTPAALTMKSESGDFEGSPLTQAPDGNLYGIRGSTIYRVKHPTTLVGSGTFSVDPFTGKVTLNPKATLWSDAGPAVLSGRPIRFSRKGALLCVAWTDAYGTATCKIPALDHDGGFDAEFTENDECLGSTVHSPLVCVANLLSGVCPEPFH